MTPLFSASDSLFAFRRCRSTRGGGTTWLRRAFASMAVLDVGLRACQVACSCLGLLSTACKPSEGAPVFATASDCILPDSSHTKTASGSEAKPFTDAVEEVTKTLKPDEVLPDLCFASHRSCVIRWPTSWISSSFFRRLTIGFYPPLFQFRRYSEQDVETLAIGGDRTPARRPRCGVPRAYAGLDLGKGGGGGGLNKSKPQLSQSCRPIHPKP